jgi:dihydrodipicolinate synthase/N-acetylneuraminate lyase
MLQGIFPVIPTLFTDDNQLDLAAQRKVVQFALNVGAQGIVFPGVASEYNFLSPEERGTLIALVAEEVAGKVPIVGGASAPTAAAAIAAGQQAADHGIHHLMVMAPHGLGQDLAAHQTFFAEITSALPQAQIILQNAPAPIGAGLDAAAIAELARSNSAITYIKEETLPSGPAITALLQAKIPHLKAVFGGGGARYIIDEFVRGARGAMPAVELTDLHVALWNAQEAGDHEVARELYRLSLPLLACQAIYRMRLTKYVLSRREIADCQHVRAPLVELDDLAKQDIDQMLEDLQAAFT